MPDITNPHDLFFRKVFGRTEIAADFLAHYLPPSVAERLDLRSLAPQPESFVDSDLRASHSDLLLRVSLHGGGEAWVYVLIEHKSFVEPLVTVQLLRYIVGIWERDARDGRSIPLPVIPIVLYHGRQPWRAPTRLSALFNGPDELRAYWPELQVVLIDLTTYAEADIVGDVRLRVAMLLMRAIYQRDLPDQLPRILALLREIGEQATLLDVLRVVLSYIAQSGAAVTTTELKHAVEVALKEPGGESMTTLVEEWLEQGRQEGLEKGLNEGRNKGREEGLHEGRNKGREEGLQEGLHEGMREAIQLSLSERFGETGPEVAALMAEIEAIENSGTLRAILRAAVAGLSIDEIRQEIG